MHGTCGAVFSINPESGAYTLMKSLPLDVATVEDFLALMEKFVNTLATWKEISDETQAAAEAGAPQEPSESPITEWRCHKTPNGIATKHRMVDRSEVYRPHAQVS